MGFFQIQLSVDYRRYPRGGSPSREFETIQGQKSRWSPQNLQSRAGLRQPGKSGHADAELSRRRNLCFDELIFIADNSLPSMLGTLQKVYTEIETAENQD